MKQRELINLGVPKGVAMEAALELVKRLGSERVAHAEMRETIAKIVKNPKDFAGDTRFGALASVLTMDEAAKASFVKRETDAPWKQWGEGLETEAVQQLRNACELPVTITGALMPDAHVGYGLPIGGVLATDNTVIPYAVGVDIACTMKLTVLDVPGGANAIRSQADRLVKAIESETRFGVGSEFRTPKEHGVLDEDWTVSPITHQSKRKAQGQLGTSGSGNHFVEFGVLVVEEDVRDVEGFGLPAGEYLALLSHSGSRGTGAAVADHYSKLAMKMHPELPKHLMQLAWLDLDSQEGQEFWKAIELMGKYAAANHACIHEAIARNLRADVISSVENHHNFAWKEIHTDPTSGEEREMIVHRKGATPAGAGVLGVIPGSMATPGFVVRGKGKKESLNSASHGAGRVMSRTKAKERFTWSAVKAMLKERDVLLLSAELDEAPGVYKDIHAVMAAQRDLVDVVARFEPKIVKMAEAGERPED